MCSTEAVVIVAATATRTNATIAARAFPVHRSAGTLVTRLTIKRETANAIAQATAATTTG